MYFWNQILQNQVKIELFYYRRILHRKASAKCLKHQPAPALGLCCSLWHRWREECIKSRPAASYRKHHKVKDEKKHFCIRIMTLNTLWNTQVLQDMHARRFDPHSLDFEREVCTESHRVNSLGGRMGKKCPQKSERLLSASKSVYKL